MLKAEFKLDPPEQVQETPIYVTFTYRNQGPRPVSFSIGNGRADGFRFRTEPAAKYLNPYYEFGGLAGITTVAPHQEGRQTVLLNRYVRFETAGRYTVHAELDVEVTEAETRARQVYNVRNDLPLTLREDDERRADILAGLAADLTGKDGAKQMQAADALAELRSPKALPVLGHGLDSPNSAVVEKMIIGLGNTGGEPARQALLRYKQSGPPQVLLLLAEQELQRIAPAPQKTGKP